MAKKNFNAYLQTGEINPWLAKSTKNEKQLQESGSNVARPWDQVKGETAKSYSAFLLYLDLGPHERSQSKLAEVIYGNPSSTATIAEWSVKHNWLVRAQAWDTFCSNTKVTRMEKAVEESEEIMLAYLPKATLTLAQAAVGEVTLGRTQMRALSDFLDRVGPSKRRRAAPVEANISLTVSAPELPESTKQEVEVQDAEIISESAQDLIPESLQEKRGKRR